MSIACCFAGAVAAAVPAGAAAQSFPSRSIRIIVGFPPGGGTDKLARLLGARLTTSLGQAVVVDNRPGAGGVVGTDLVAKSQPDGHTLLVTTSAYTISASLQAKLPYDPITGLAPVALFATSPSMLVTHPSLPVKSVRELIAFARANPGKLNYGSSGNGAPYHIATELFKSMAGVDIAHVPYKGAAPAVTAVLGGEVTMLFANIMTGLPLARSGRMRGLAVTSEARTPIAADIPTVAEAGVPGYAFVTWFGALAPGGTPAPIVERLNTAFRQAIVAPDIANVLVADGVQAHDGAPEAFAQVIRSDIQRFTKLARQVGMTVD
jgi:tripartite-type tricarboxylate transporter receptor subunit TctC